MITIKILIQFTPLDYVDETSPLNKLRISTNSFIMKTMTDLFFKAFKNALDNRFNRKSRGRDDVDFLRSSPNRNNMLKSLLEIQDLPIKVASSKDSILITFNKNQGNF